MDNIVTVLFDVESEAYQALSNLRANPATDSYVVAEAALLKKEARKISVIESVDSGVRTADDTITGMLVGSIAGILAGPMGVLLGASTGALVGATVDAIDADDDTTLLEQVANKLYDGETAVIALVQENEEAAFDAAFDGLSATIIRRDAAAVAEDVELARRAEVDAARVAREQMRAQRETEFQNKVEGYRATIGAKFDEIKARHAQTRAELKDNIAELFGDKDDKPVPVGEQLGEGQMDSVSGGKVSVDLSIDVINQLNAYITQCKIGGMTLDAALNGLSSLHLEPGQLELAKVYVRQVWISM